MRSGTREPLKSADSGPIRDRITIRVFWCGDATSADRLRSISQTAPGTIPPIAPAVFEFIEGWYNLHGRHSELNSPAGPVRNWLYDFPPTLVDFAHVGQTVPKQPLWDTFRAEKPKVFWALLGFKSLLLTTQMLWLDYRRRRSPPTV